MSPGHQSPEAALEGRLEGAEDTSDWYFRIYIAGLTPKSTRALENLKKLCEELLEGTYRIEVVDLMKHPNRAAMDQILAIPTVVRKAPQPEHKIIGDLSDRNRVVAGLGIEHLVGGGVDVG